MLTEVIVLLVISAISIICHFVITGRVKKVKSNIESLIGALEEVSKEKGLTISIESSENAKPSYDYVDKKITLEEGNSLGHVAAAYHELGHAIDHHKVLHKTYRWYHHLLFYVFKYSLPFSVVMYILQKNLYTDSTAVIVVTCISMALSIWFAVQTLKEEVVATKYALQVMKEKNVTSASELPIVKWALFNGMQSYLVIVLLAFMLVGFEFYYLLTNFV